MCCEGTHSIRSVTIVGNDVARELPPLFTINVAMETDHRTCEYVRKGVVVLWKKGGGWCVCVCVCVCVYMCACVCVCVCACEERVREKL